MLFHLEMNGICEKQTHEKEFKDDWVITEVVIFLSRALDDHL